MTEWLPICPPGPAPEEHAASGGAIAEAWEVLRTHRASGESHRDRISGTAPLSHYSASSFYWRDYRTGEWDIHLRPLVTFSEIFACGQTFRGIR